MAALQGYTILLYKEFGKNTGMSSGFHGLGGVTLAVNQDRFTCYTRNVRSTRYMGLPTEIVSPKRLRKLHLSQIRRQILVVFTNRWTDVFIPLAPSKTMPNAHARAGPQLKSIPR